MHVSNFNNNNHLNNNNNNNKVYLNNSQTDKLKHILDRSIPIYSSSSSTFPTLNLTPRHFLRQVFYKLKEYDIDITGVHLNGGAASYVLVNDPNFLYRDIDILIHIQTPLSSEQKTTLFSSNNQSYLCDVWTIIKYIICSCLLEHITLATSTEQTSTQYTHHYLSNVLDTYTRKNIKISSESDSWALLSLQNYSGQNLELKFVEHLKRQWQFSVDSFQINLEPLLLFETKSYPSQTYHRHNCKYPSISSITKTIKTKNLIIDAINGLTIIKNECHDNDENNEQQHDDKDNMENSEDKYLLNSNSISSSSSPLQFGFFTPSSSPKIVDQENNIECQTLATITTISTSNIYHNSIPECRSRLSKSSISTLYEESANSSLQFQLSINDDTDDGIVSDADDSLTEDDDQVFRTPVDTNSAPPSPATIIAVDVPSSSSSSPSLLIEVYSAYHDFHQALEHLNKKLIATYAPETIRGGGLLKYCDLLAQNYKVHDVSDMFRMQRYMCSRFFIDYKTEPEQRHVISQYVATHFIPSTMNNTEQSIQRRNYLSNSKSLSSENHVNNARLCLLFFNHLFNVIQQSTVCLTHHDKQITLMMINDLKDLHHFNYKNLFPEENYHQQRYHAYQYQHQHYHHNHNHNHHNYHHHQQQQQRHHNHCSSSSSNSSRSSSPSSSSSNSCRYYRSNNNLMHHRHHNGHYRHHNHLQRQSSNSSFHHLNGSRIYSNQSILTNSYQRRV